jgi:hypothetical protein
MSTNIPSSTIFFALIIYEDIINVTQTYLLRALVAEPVAKKGGL